jgi:hypothetical protein
MTSVTHRETDLFEDRRRGQVSDTGHTRLKNFLQDGLAMEEGSRFGPPELRWAWSITSIVPAITHDARHRADARRSHGEVSRRLG